MYYLLPLSLGHLSASWTLAILLLFVPIVSVNITSICTSHIIIKHSIWVIDIEISISISLVSSVLQKRNWKARNVFMGTFLRATFNSHSVVNASSSAKMIVYKKSKLYNLDFFKVIFPVTTELVTCCYLHLSLSVFHTA